MTLGEAQVLALRLASGGWWGGNPGSILSAPADEVMLAIQYTDFKGTYESEMIKIARKEIE